MKKLVLIILCTLSLNLIFSCGNKEKLNLETAKSNNLKYSANLRMWQDKHGTRFAEVLGMNSDPLQLYVFPTDSSLVDIYRKTYPEAVYITDAQGNLLVYSSVFSHALSELGAFDLIGGVVDSQYFSDSAVMNGLESGKIKDMGASSSLSVEELIASRPTLALVSVYDGMDVAALQRTGIPIAYMADNLEQTPLGRAEWIKFLGLISGQPSKGDSIFNAVEKRYDEVRKKVSAATKKPKVMVENMYQGQWYVPGGNSYAAALINDAGGFYPWSDNSDAGSLTLSFEEVYSKCSDADIWLLRLFGVDLDSSILRDMDNRNMLFGPVKEHQVWYSNTQSSGIFDEFPYHPELILEDYIAIFHPEMTKTDSLRYFRKMTY